MLMRVLVTSFTYAPRRDGVQFVTQYLCEGLVARGHHVTVITEQHQGLPYQEIINHVRVERWPVGTHHLHHYGPRKEFVQWVLDHQDYFDVMINVGTQTPFTDWLLPYINGISLPKILHVHSIWDFKMHAWDLNSFDAFAKKITADLRWGIYYAMHKSAFRAYDRVLQLYPQDYSVADFHKWYGIDSNILMNAAEDAFHQGAPIPIEQRRKSIVCVANFNQQKNQIALIKAFLQSNLADWELDLIGSRPTSELNHMKNMEKMIREQMGAKCNNKHINYYIGLDRRKIIKCVQTASIYALSSLREAFPVSLIEAMSAGLPWVSTDVGIIRYLPGGIVINDISQLQVALEKLANNPHLRASLGIQGYRYAAEHFRINDKVSQLEHILTELVSKEK